MEKTTMMLPPSLKRRALAHAAAQKISLGELIRRGLEMIMSDPALRRTPADDPFLDDPRTFEGDAPQNLAANHDLYLYQEDR